MNSMKEILAVVARCESTLAHFAWTLSRKKHSGWHSGFGRILPLAPAFRLRRMSGARSRTRAHTRDRFIARTTDIVGIFADLATDRQVKQRERRAPASWHGQDAP